MSGAPGPDTLEAPPGTQIASRPDPEKPDGEELDDDELDGAGGRMSFLDHLDELRKRLVTSVSAVFIGFVAAFPFIVSPSCSVSVKTKRRLNVS